MYEMLFDTTNGLKAGEHVAADDDRLKTAPIGVWLKAGTLREVPGTETVKKEMAAEADKLRERAEKAEAERDAAVLAAKEADAKAQGHLRTIADRDRQIQELAGTIKDMDAKGGKNGK